ncbi:hypothetical protein [Oceanithermus sp.]
MLHPRYNARTVVELVSAAGAKTVYLASYSEEGLEKKIWRDRNELPLFELNPLVEEGLFALRGLGENAESLQREAELFVEYLGNMPRGDAAKEKLADIDRELSEYLSVPRLPDEFASEDFVAGLEQILNKQAEFAGEGPATGFRRQRMEQVAEALAGASDAVVLVDVLDYPVLVRLLPDARRPWKQEPTRAEMERAILDRAWRLEGEEEWGGLLAQLSEIGSAEAGYLASQIYLAARQPEDSLRLLEEVSQGDFSRPEYLPGYVLARLGQLYDLVNRRDKAIRAYTAALALSWVPPEVREIAQAGLRAPFKP